MAEEIASAFVKIRPDMSGFAPEVGRGVDAGLKPVEQKTKQTGMKVRQAFSGMFAGLAGTGALGPFSGVVAQMDAFAVAMEGKSRSIGKGLLAAGAGASALGGVFAAAASADQAAQGQLRATIQATGHEYEEYEKRIEEAVKRQERFGFTAHQTQDALNRLTQVTHDPEKALKDLSLATEIAASRHIALTQAATLVGRAEMGNTRTLKMFGLTAVDAKGAADKLASAQKAHATATEDARKATQAYHDRLAELHGVSKLTVAQQISLRNAADRMHEANRKVAQTARDEAEARKAAAKATKDQGGTMDRLAGILRGQASASADTFTGRLKAMRATAEDAAAAIGKRVGGALVVAGPALAGIGGIIETGLIGKLGKGLGNLFTYIRGINLAAIATKIWTGIQAAFNLVMDANPIVLVGLAIGALVAAFILAYKHSERFREIVQAALHGIATAAKWAWETVLRPTFEAIGKAALWVWRDVLQPTFHAIAEAWKVTFTAAKWAWDHILFPVFALIGKWVMWLWRDIVKPVFTIIGGLIYLQFKVVELAWTKVLWPVFKAIGAVVGWLYTHAVKPYFHAISTEIHGTFAAGKWAWEHVLRPVFHAIAEVVGWLWDRVVKPNFRLMRDEWGVLVNAGKWAWDHVLKPVFHAIGDAAGATKRSFETAVTGIKAAWDKLSGIAKAPIKFIVSTVLNQGLLKAWNWISDHMLDKKFHVNAISLPPGFAGGGIAPGWSPGRDDQLVPVSGGEAIMRPEWTRAVGAQRVHRWNAAARRGGVAAVLAELTSGFADGGIVGGLANLGGKLWSGVNTLARGVTDFLKDPAGWLRQAVSSALAGLRQFTGPYGQMAGTAASTMVSHVLDAAKHLVGFGGGVPKGGVIPSGAHAALIRQALGLAGVADNAANEWAVNLIVQHESGWNPNAINLTDVNAQRGDPSRGLMQTIGATFRAYALPALRNIFGALDNLVAGIRYAVSRYGSLLNTPGPRSVLAGGPYRPYDTGGWLPPGLTMAWNGTGAPERVLGPGEHRTGPAVHIEHATFTDGADLDLLLSKVQFAGSRL